jgi:hypothetical protein
MNFTRGRIFGAAGNKHGYFVTRVENYRSFNGLPWSAAICNRKSTRELQPGLAFGEATTIYSNQVT